MKGASAPRCMVMFGNKVKIIGVVLGAAASAYGLAVAGFDGRTIMAGIGSFDMIKPNVSGVWRIDA